jgi:hypothetical protein
MPRTVHAAGIDHTVIQDAHVIGPECDITRTHPFCVIGHEAQPAFAFSANHSVAGA